MRQTMTRMPEVISIFNTYGTMMMNDSVNASTRFCRPSGEEMVALNIRGFVGPLSVKKCDDDGARNTQGHSIQIMLSCL